MKKIGLTQRVEKIESYKEQRDSLDQRWFLFCEALNLIPIPLFNVHPDITEAYLDRLKLDGIILTGGNSLSFLTPSDPASSPERDEFEKATIQWSIMKQVPLIGICRGFQLLNHFFGGKLSLVDDHVAIHHPITFQNSLSPLGRFDVNSYHSWGVKREDLAEELIPLASHEDGTIEAFEHEELKILAFMCHPERDSPFNPQLVKIIRSFLK